MSREDFAEKISSVVSEKSDNLLTLLHSKNLEEFINLLPEKARAHKGVLEIKELMKKLAGFGIKNVVFSPTLMRGFDYYTGIVFEIFDTNPENRRAIFGGGRYDDLLSIFGAEKFLRLVSEWEMLRLAMFFKLMTSCRNINRLRNFIFAF